MHDTTKSFDQTEEAILTFEVLRRRAEVGGGKEPSRKLHPWGLHCSVSLSRVTDWFDGFGRLFWKGTSEARCPFAMC